MNPQDGIRGRYLDGFKCYRQCSGVKEIGARKSRSGGTMRRKLKRKTDELVTLGHNMVADRWAGWQKQGHTWHIVPRNYSTKIGLIDLIMEKNWGKEEKSRRKIEKSEG